MIILTKHPITGWLIILLFSIKVFIMFITRKEEYKWRNVNKMERMRKNARFLTVASLHSVVKRSIKWYWWIFLASLIYLFHSLVILCENENYQLSKGRGGSPHSGPSHLKIRPKALHFNLISTARNKVLNKNNPTMNEDRILNSAGELFIFFHFEFVTQGWGKGVRSS